MSIIGSLKYGIFVQTSIYNWISNVSSCSFVSSSFFLSFTFFGLGSFFYENIGCKNEQNLCVKFCPIVYRSTPKSTLAKFSHPVMTRPIIFPPEACISRQSQADRQHTHTHSHTHVSLTHISLDTVVQDILNPYT